MAGQRLPEIVDQAARMCGPGSCRGRSARDPRRNGVFAQQQACGFTQAALGAVAHHGIADFLGDGEAQAHGRRQGASALAAPGRAWAFCGGDRRNSARGQLYGNHRQSLTRRGGVSLRLFLRLPARRRMKPRLAPWRHGPKPRVKPKGACGPWRGGWQEPCGRRQSPCGRGIHAGACGRAWTVDRCASRGENSNGGRGTEDVPGMRRGL